MHEKGNFSSDDYPPLTATQQPVDIPRLRETGGRKSKGKSETKSAPVYSRHILSQAIRKELGGIESTVRRACGADATHIPIAAQVLLVSW